MSKRALYKQLLEFLPNHCENVTPSRVFREQDLQMILEDFTVFRRNHPVRRLRGAPDQECHAVSAWLWKTNPGYRIICGMAYSEELNESCSDWHFHSFCVDQEGVIVEPTPIVRDWYVGSVLTPEQATVFYEEEVENIKKLFPGEEASRPPPGLRKRS